MVKSVKPNVGIKGMDVVLANLNREIAKIEARSSIGLIESAILIRQDMDKISPKIPIDFGNLRASWFTVTSHGFGAGSQGGTGMPFKGPDAGKLAAERAQAISEGRGIVQGVKGLAILMGFSANYALFVHENVEADFTSSRKRKGKIITRRSGAGAKFFEAALNRNKNKILQIIGNNARIKS